MDSLISSSWCWFSCLWEIDTYIFFPILKEEKEASSSTCSNIEWQLRHTATWPTKQGSARVVLCLRLLMENFTYKGTERTGPLYVSVMVMTINTWPLFSIYTSSDFPHPTWLFLSKSQTYSFICNYFNMFCSKFFSLSKIFLKCYGHTLSIWKFLGQGLNQQPTP